jgi:hypothetical protein
VSHPFARRGADGSAAPKPSTLAKVIRDSDAMRTGIAGHALEVSASSLALMLETPLEITEHIYVELENTLQRVRVRVRACVEQIEPCDDGVYRLACSLLTRLTPRDVRGLSPMGGWGTGSGMSVAEFWKRRLAGGRGE